MPSEPSEQHLGPLIVDVAGTVLTDADKKILAEPLVGGVILFTRNFESFDQISELTAAMRAAAGKRLLITVDHEGGRVQRFRDSGFTRLPAAALLPAIDEQNSASAQRTAEEMGWLMATECRAADIDVSWAPVLDRNTGASEIIGDRAFGRDAEQIERLAGAYIAGMAELGMAATGKHFPGHGAVIGDSHELLPVDKRSEAEIAEDMACFKVLLPRLHAVMMAHVVYPEVDSLPASFSSRWIREKLRADLGYGGAVVCDDLSMEGAATIGNYVDRARVALAAGCDWLPVCNNREGVEEILTAGSAILATDDQESAVRRALLLPREPKPENGFRWLPRWKAATAVAELAA